MLYIIEVTAYTAAMLLLYVLFLRNRPLHAQSRYYLLACALLPLLLPLVQLPTWMQQKIQSAVPYQMALPAFTTGAGASPAPMSHTATAGMPLPYLIYMTVSVVLLFIQIIYIVRMLMVAKKGVKEKHEGYTLIKSSGYGPGSFGRYIFIPGEEIDSMILAHEQAHIRQHHTADLMVLGIVQALAWPNLLLIWIKKELKVIHEFQADEQASADRNEYAALLLGAVFSTRPVPVMHSFIIHPIKRRIMMLSKKGTASPVKAMLQIAASSALLLAGILFFQSCSKKTAAVKQDTGDIHKTADVMPKYPGGSDSMRAFMGREIKYPEAARDKKIAGRVVVKFVVNANGDVVTPEIVKSPDTLLSTAALAMVNKMPKWEPGRMNDGELVSVYFYLPVAFKLDN